MGTFLLHFTRFDDDTDYWWRCQARDYKHAESQLRESESDVDFCEFYKD